MMAKICWMLHLLLVSSFSWSITFDIQEEVHEFLTVEQAFQVEVEPINDKITVHWQAADDYYLYAHQFTVSIDGNKAPFTFLSPGLVKYDETFQRDLEVYYGQVSYQFPWPANADTLTLSYQGCADAGLCYPPSKRYFKFDTTAKTFLEVASKEKLIQLPDVRASQQSSKQASILSFWTALLFAFLGGLVLNLMPCVFPVLALKVYGLANHSDAQSSRVSVWIYALGVLVSFLAVAGLLLALRALGESIGWGFQLQSPWVLGGLICLFFVMALSLSGFAQIGAGWVSTGQGLADKKGHLGSFFTGVLAVIVASPCTAPFMASALGYAVLQPSYEALLIFASLGIGMAAPMLLVGYFPQWLKHLPSSGAWMETFKELLAFPLYLTCIWLIWVLGNATNANTVALFLVGLLGMVSYFWLRKKTSHRAGYLVLLFTVIFIVAVINQSSSTNHTSSAVSFSLAELDTKIPADHPIFVDVTADWCLTCQVNEATSLRAKPVEQAFTQAGVEVIIADWTKPNQDINQLLARHQRVGIPLYLYYPAGSTQPKILPQLLTSSMLVALTEQ